MAKTVVEELVTLLGFDIDDKKLDAFNKKSQSLKNTLKKIAAVASAAAIGLTAWVSKVAIATDANIKFADSIDVTFQAMQELQFATEREGGSLQSLQSGLLSLTMKASEAFRGIGSGVEIFGLLGVSVRDTNGKLKTSDVLLSDIADAFQRFDKIKQVEFASKLGLSPDLLRLLQKGSKNIEELRSRYRDLGQITEETARNSEELQDSLTDVRQVVRILTTNIAGDLMPIVVDLIDQFIKWTLANKELIKQNITKVTKGLVKVMTVLVKNAKILLIILGLIVGLKFAAVLGGIVFGIGALVVGVATLNVKLLATNALLGGIPLLIGLAIAAIVAFGLFVQDIFVFLDGGESVFGRLSEGESEASKKLKKFADAFRTIESVMVSIGNAIDKINEGLEKMTELLFSPLLKDNKLLEFQQDTLKRDLDALQRFDPDVFEGPPHILPQSNDIKGGDTNITAPITINSENGDPRAIAEEVAAAITGIARNGISNQPIVVQV